VAFKEKSISFALQRRREVQISWVFPRGACGFRGHGVWFLSLVKEGQEGWLSHQLKPSGKLPVAIPSRNSPPLTLRGKLKKQRQVVQRRLMNDLTGTLRVWMFVP